MAVDTLAGLDVLQGARAAGPGAGRAARVWSATWPKLLALGLVIAVWQIVVWSGWRPTYVLPGPRAAFGELWDEAHHAVLWKAIAITMRRAVTGFAFAVVIGSAIGLAVSRFRVLRAAIGSLITGVQTMPSIAWFPLAILVFQPNETAIFFVVVLGAAPSIANGLISGVDYTPPLLLRAGKVLGLRGLALYRHVIVPASLPAFVGGLKQGWAFAWRSLMAGELLVLIAHEPSIGVLLENDQNSSSAQAVIAIMIVIIVIGMVVDSLFGVADRGIRRRRGITVGSAAG
ncbi:MAG TPA: ABC transporter permease [Streptosporangiaceae bacterium]|nr:ABC transporter permease [Streptosporangiaceae bacterium]